MNKISKSDKIRFNSTNKFVPSVPLGELLFFLFWPFALLFHVLIKFRLPYAKTLFWMFCIYFGFVFIYADPFKSGGADSARFAAKLIEIHANPFSWETLFNSFYNAQEGVVDIYQPLVTWLVGLITGDPRVLFMIFAAVFGFFYAQNLWMIFNTISKKVVLTLFLFMLAYALVNPIWNINGVRMWTAAQIFLFGNLRYFLFKEKKGLIWSIGAIFVHFSFLFPAAILIVYIFLPKKDHLFFAFYVITAFFIEIQLNQVREFLSFLPAVFQPRVEGYTNENYAGQIGEELSRATWHVIWQSKFSAWFGYLWIAALYIKRKHWEKYHPEYYQMFVFALLLGGFANIAAQIPSGGRFIMVANGLFYALFLALLGQRKVNLRIRWLELTTIPFLTFVVIFKIRLGFDYTGILTFFGNPIIAPFINEQTPLIEFLKQLF